MELLICPYVLVFIRHIITTLSIICLKYLQLDILGARLVFLSWIRALEHGTFFDAGAPARRPDRAHI